MNYLLLFTSINFSIILCHPSVPNTVNNSFNKKLIVDED